jgi:Gas vesicle protein
MSISGPVARRPHSSRDLVSAPGSTNLADLLERVLDKGVVIAGDIVLSLGSVELLTLKIRLLISSIDKARELGIDWWESDLFLSSRARERELEKDRDLLKERLDRLERLLLAPPQNADQEHAEAGQRRNAAPASVLDKDGSVIAELKQPGPQRRPEGRREEEQEQEEEQPQTQERAPQPAAEQNAASASVLDEEGRVIAELKQPGQQPQEEDQLQAQERASQLQEEERPQARQPVAAQAEQPAGAGPLLGPARQKQIVQALQPVLAEFHQRITQAVRQQMKHEVETVRKEPQQEGQQAREPSR